MSTNPTGVERDPLSAEKPGSATWPHLRLTQIEFKDQTDVHNELVHEREWLLHPAEKLALCGNLFVLENTLLGEGTVYLKRGPLPHARPEPGAVDFSWRDDMVTLHRNGYEWVQLPFTGGRFGAQRALQNYQREVRPFVPGRDGLFLSNTWGDRSRDARVNEEFMLLEIEAGARLGVEVIQIDDGWQKGRTANSAEAGGVWIGFWAANAQFWDVNEERFPNGLEPLIEAARQRGMQFGLWFAPDSADDFANWERDADAILGLHRELGVNYFKIDGVKAETSTGEANLRRFFETVLRESNHRVIFDLDVTAEIRPGYWGSMDTGPLFVENRYTDWHRYWPHFTLRNLWKLAQWVDPARLRFEFLNNARNAQLYANDPLAPATYAPDYLFATVMFSNPLGWFEVSNLPQSYIESVAPLVEIWKQHRDAIFGGTIYPIGSAPDGTGWTGFVSIAADGESGYVLIFRGLSQAAHEPEEGVNLVTPPIEGYGKVQVLSGEGWAGLHGSTLSVGGIPSQRFLFGKF